MAAPVFVKIENYKQIEDTLKEIKGKIEDAKHTLTRIQDLKAEEEHDLASWQTEIRKVEEKVRITEQSISR